MCKVAFEKLKDSFKKVPYLILFSSKKPIQIEIDVSDKDIGIYLL